MDCSDKSASSNIRKEPQDQSVAIALSKRREALKEKMRRDSLLPYQTRFDRNNDLYFFKDRVTGEERTTGIFASSPEAARKKCKRPPPDRAVLYKTVKYKDLTPAQKRAAKAGRWVGREKGDTRRGFGPPPKNYRK